MSQGLGLFGTGSQNQSQGTKPSFVGLFNNSPSQPPNTQQYVSAQTNNQGLGINKAPINQGVGLFSQPNSRNAGNAQPGLFNSQVENNNQAPRFGLSSSQVSIDPALQGLPDHIRAQKQSEIRSMQGSSGLFNNSPSVSPNVQKESPQILQPPQQFNLLPQASTSPFSQPSPPKKPQPPQVSQGPGLFGQPTQKSTSVMNISSGEQNSGPGLFKSSQNPKPNPVQVQPQPPKMSNQPGLYGWANQPPKAQSVPFQAQPLSQGNLFSSISSGPSVPSVPQSAGGLFGAQSSSFSQNPPSKGGLFGAQTTVLSQPPKPTSSRQDPTKELLNKQFQDLFDGVSYDMYTKVLRQKADEIVRELPH